MIRYNIRSRQLVDVVGDIKREKIILSPYFQRNLVWRQVHKIDFIKTILLGFPFPQIFIAKGEIDIEDMTSTSVIVDGQQRMNSIIEFLNGEFEVDESYFNDLARGEKDDFLKYEVAIIELDMQSDNPDIIEIFKRLNRTFYSLSTIEKLATEYAPSEFMLVAKMLSNEIKLTLPKDVKVDPNITIDFIKWAKSKKSGDFSHLIIDSPIFTTYEISRKVHLMITLNIMATTVRGFFNRNLKISILDEYSDNFPEKDEIVELLNKSAKIYLDLKLKKSSYWYNKVNFFSLIILIYNNLDYLSSQNSVKLNEKLNKFAEAIPDDYQLAAKEAVNNKRERTLRNTYLEKLLLQPTKK